MFEALIKSIEDTFVQFTFKRLLYILFLLSLVLGSLYIFDRLTGYTFYWRLEEKLSAVERLQALEEKKIQESQNLAPIYDSLVKELSHEPKQFFEGNFRYEPLIKLIGATVVFLLLILYFAVQLLRVKGEDNFAGLIGSLVFAVPLGIIGVVAPSFYSVWLNLIIGLVVQIVLILLIMRFGNKKNQESVVIINNP